MRGVLVVGSALLVAACSSFSDATTTDNDAGGVDASTPDVGALPEDAGDASVSDAMPRSTPTFVQAAASEMGSSLNTTAIEVDVTLPMKSNVGDLRIVSVSWDTGASAPPSIVDESANSYEPVSAPISWASTAYEQLFYAKNVRSQTASPAKLKIQFNKANALSGDTVQARVFEYTGVGPSVAIEQSSEDAQPATTPIDTGLVATNSAGDLIFGVAQVGRGNCQDTSLLTLNPDLPFKVTPRPVMSSGSALAFDGVLAMPSSVHVGLAAGCSPDYWVAQIVAFH